MIQHFYSKMNKKGDAGDSPIWNNVVYLIILVVFIGVLFVFVNNQRDNAFLWEDFYAKEISKVINSNDPGTAVTLDVTEAIEVARKRGQSYSDIFSFDNRNGKVIVSLRPSGGTSFDFFNRVIVADWSVEFFAGDDPRSLLTFKILEVGEDDL